jgi:3-deoxy-D-manno-octulosonic-acid transferase
MKFIFEIVYNCLFIPFGKAYFAFFSLFKNKISQRTNKIHYLIDYIPNKQYAQKRIWFHSSSMGEFEQAKPVIEKLKLIKPDISIICTFFSPSGYENQKNYKYADYVLYIPFDCRYEASKFLSKLDCDLAVFVRYDTWFNHLKILNIMNIPVILINGTIPGGTDSLIGLISKPYFQYIYSFFTKIFTVGERHTNFYKNNIKCKNVFTLNDTRLDRISSQVESASKNPVIPNGVFDNEFVMVAGSSWEKDEELIYNAIDVINTNNFILRTIFVPHEPTPIRIEQICKKVKDSILLSELEPLFLNDSIENIKLILHNKHIIVDSIGKLLRLYANADAAFVGCGFGDGVHSTVEPAGYSIPVASGPNILKSPDAMELKKIGALRIVKYSDDLTHWISNFINNPTDKDRIGKIAGDYVNNSKGSTDKIVDELLNILDKS